MAKKFISGVVLKETFVKFRRKWIFRFIFVNLVYIIAIAGLWMVIIEKKKTIPSFSDAMQTIEEYRTKDKLYGILRTRGYNLVKGLILWRQFPKNQKSWHYRCH